MSLPSKQKQVEAVVQFLDSEFMESRTLDEVAKAIVNGYHEALMSGVKSPAPPLRVGMLIKTPIDGKVRRIAWMDEHTAWFVTDSAGNGWLGSISSPLWDFCEEYRPKKRIDNKMVEMTDDMIAKEWSNPDWKVGNRVSQNQRGSLFEVIATGPQSVLLMGSDGFLRADSNSSMEKYYRREISAEEATW